MNNVIYSCGVQCQQRLGETNIIAAHLLVVIISQLFLHYFAEVFVIWPGGTSDLGRSRGSGKNVALPLRVAGASVYSIRGTETCIVVNDEYSSCLNNGEDSEDGHADGTNKTYARIRAEEIIGIFARDGRV
jgi:hypothetical protein